MKLILRLSVFIFLITNLSANSFADENYPKEKNKKKHNNSSRLRKISRSKRTANTEEKFVFTARVSVVKKGNYYSTLLKKSKIGIINSIKDNYKIPYGNDYSQQIKKDEKIKKLPKLNLPDYIREQLLPPKLKYLSKEEREKLNIDSLLENWYAKNKLLNINISEEAVEETEADSIFEKRIEEIPSGIDLLYNEQVKKEIKIYTRKKSKNYIQRLIGKAQYYIPYFEATLDNYGLPLELKYLPIIESAINPVAVSRAGATGMWQFMPRTGKNMDLDVNRYVDERRDPLKSSEAAAKYFSSLYKRYNDWTLALAAYNCGPGNLNRAIKRSGKKTYWEIQSYLPRETQKYIPRYIAATYLMYYYDNHQLSPQQTDLPQNTDTVLIQQPLHLSQVASVLNIDIELLRTLNPQYKKDLIPAKDKSYNLNLPLREALRFASLRDSIFSADIKTSNYKMSNFTAPQITDISKCKKLKYTVKSGDNIGLIAQWYNLRSADIKSWNNLYTNKIIVGDELNIYIPKKQARKYEKINTLSYEVKQAKYYGRKGRNPKIKAKTIKKEDGYLYYTVKSGDNFWDISKKFKGVSCDDIMRINHFSKRTRINPGDLIKIKKI